MLSKQTSFNLKNYNGLFKEGHANDRAHGEVAMFNHETITYQNLIPNIPLQSISAKINIGRDVTIVSNYNSRSRAVNENLFSTLFQQIPKPVRLTGYFNNYHQIWESPGMIIWDDRS